MKKVLIFALVVLMILPLAVSCSNVEFEISFIVDDKVYATVDTNGAEAIRLPVDPQKEGYEFRGWYWDEGTWQQPFTANSLLYTPISSDVEVFAYFAEPGTPDPDDGNEEEDNGKNESAKWSNTPFYAVPCDTNLVYSYTDSVNNYFVFKIGEVRNVPLHIYDSQGHDGYRDVLIGETIETVSIEKVTSRDETEITNEISGEVSGSITAKLENKLGATFKGVVSAETKRGIEGTISATLSNTYTSVTDTECITEIETRVTKTQIRQETIPADAPVGKYYLALTCACDVYVTVVCNIPENSYSYVYSSLIKKDTIIANDRLYSESQVLDSNSVSTLRLDESALEGLDFFGSVENNKFIEKTIDFSKLYALNGVLGERNVSFWALYDIYSKEDPGETFQELQNELKPIIEGTLLENYDLDTRTFMLYGMINGENVDRYVIKGLYGKPDRDTGYEIETVFDDISFCIFSNDDIEIVFDSFAFVQSPAKSAIFMDKKSNPEINLTISSEGKKNMIRGIDAKTNVMYSSARLPDVIDASTISSLTFDGYAPMSIMGAEYHYYGSEAVDGAVAVNAKKVTVNMNEGAELEIKGGNGTDAVHSSASTGGRAGYHGGNGGSAIVANSVTINGGVCKFIGGNGGNGGAGGFGDIGCRGGDGGNGGDGGIGLNSGFVTVNAGDVTVIGGNGGAAASGRAGTAGRNADAVVGASATNGGDGGNSGTGGNGAPAIKGQQFTVNGAESVTACGGNAGRGGRGGNGGDGGQPFYSAFVGTKGGKGGKGGSAGSAGNAVDAQIVGDTSVIVATGGDSAEGYGDGNDGVGKGKGN